MNYSINLCNHASINLNYLLYIEKISKSKDEIVMSNYRIPITSNYKNGLIRTELFNVEMEDVWYRLIDSFVATTSEIINGDLMNWDRINFQNKSEIYKTLFKPTHQGIAALEGTWEEFAKIWYMPPFELSLKLDSISEMYVEPLGKSIEGLSDKYNLNSYQKYSIQTLIYEPYFIDVNRCNKYFLYCWSISKNVESNYIFDMTERLIKLIISNNH